MGRTLLLILAVGMLGCFGTHGSTPPDDRCSATKSCFPTDDFGCCTTRGGASVSVCEACPAGTVELTSCRASGCDDPCDPGGTGRDPAGADEAPLIYPSPEPDPLPPPPPLNCLEDLGGGCCGDIVVASDVCGLCPAGTVQESECGAYAETVGDRIVPPTECRQDFGGGCCGDYAERNACSGECPAGSIEETACADFILAGGAAEPPPEEPLPPGSGMPRPDPGACIEDLGAACCGETVVEPTACGSCPVGFIFEWECETWGADLCD